MPQADKTSQLEQKAGQLVELALRAGADKADAVASRGQSLSVSVRLGKVENTEASDGDSFSLRVFVGNRVASISANADADPQPLAERAVAMAKVSPADPFATLADSEDLVTEIVDLDLFDPTEPDADALTDAALAVEAAALAEKGITNSVGAGASAGMAGMVLVTSDGFCGSYRRSAFGRSVSVIAGEGTAMERDYEFDSRVFYSDLWSPEKIGRSAAERAVRRLNPKKAKTGSNVAIVCDPRVARGITAHIAAAINGASVARKTSFLKDKMEQRVLPEAITLTDDPFIRRGSASRPFDGEGVKAEKLNMIENGILRHWFLSTGTARQLGLKTNGRGVRSGSNVNPSSTNVAIEPGTTDPQDLIRNVDYGFYVTEVIGQGVNMITGEYSRGASGFMIENGELTYPVSEVTIASNMKDMFMRMTAASDIDRKFSSAAPTLLIEGMTLAGL